MRIRPLPRPARRVLLVGMLAVAAAGSNCASNYRIANTENFLTYDRPFTDASLEVSRKDAESICADRKMVTIKTSDVCDMTRCFTNYQCVGKAEVPQVVR
jgi:hypothetical protein